MPNRRSALPHFMVRIVRAAGTHPPGADVASFLPCRRRPGRRPCPGRLVLRRQEVPPTVHWRCPACADSGTVAFEGGFPREHLRPPVPPGELLELLLTAEEWRAALGATEDTEVEAILLAAETWGDQACLRLADAELMLLNVELFGFLAFGKPGRARRALQQVVRKGTALLAQATSELAAGPGAPPARPGRQRRRRGRACRSRRGARTMHQLKITLRDIRPPVWRRVLVPSDIPLDRLHLVVQAVMGWMDCHLHEWSCGDERYGQPAAIDWEPPADESDVTLAQLAPRAGDRLSYCYDFGDDWRHEVRVEKVLPRDPEMELPECLTGRRACPPEDCGGPWGYGELLAVLADPRHPEHKEMMEWVGGSIDPNHFDLEETRLRLRDWLGQLA